MRKIMRWGLKNVLRFPILEIIVVLAVFQLGGIWILVNSFQVGGTRSMVSVSSLHLLVGRFIYRIVAYNLIDSRMIIYFLASLLFTISFAYELDTNLTKLYMSYPVRRRDYFVSKCFSSFAVLFVTFLVVGIGFAVFLDPSYFSSILSSPFILAYVLLLAVLLLFASSVATTIALLSKNTALSFIGSFFVLYMIDSAAAKIRISPSYFMKRLQSTLFTGTTSFFENGGVNCHIAYTDVLKIMCPPLIISIMLFLISFIYYTTYFEVKS